MGKFIGNRTRGVLGVLTTAAAIAALTFSGCGKSDDSDDPADPVGPGGPVGPALTSSQLVNAENEVWAACDAAGKCGGTILNTSSFLDIYSADNGVKWWAEPEMKGTWSLNGSQITLTYNDGSLGTGAVSLLGNVLVVVNRNNVSYAYTRRPVTWANVDGFAKKSQSQGEVKSLAEFLRE